MLKKLTISPGFYEQLSGTEVIKTSFLYSHFSFVVFSRRKLAAVHKMLVIFTRLLKISKSKFRKIKVRISRLKNWHQES
jgi:hypothetical protein